MTRIYKTEKFIPANGGSPVFQVLEEDESGRRFDPRNPTPEELEDADDAFAAAQQATIATLTEQLTAANARIASLLNGMPWNPRVIDASAFISRISSQELLLLASSSDPMLQQIIGMLNQWKANDWPIVLDSPEIQQAVGYLAQQGVFAESRIAEVLRDCTQEESYVADE
jgi:hypothetical protein